MRFDLKRVDEKRARQDRSTATEKPKHGADRERAESREQKEEERHRR